MQAAVRECPICKNRKNVGINFGVFCCKACQMFFRRVIFQKVILSECETDGPCRPNCKQCRFKKCVQHGLLYIPTARFHSPLYQDMLSALLFNVKLFDADRVYKLENCYIPGDPTVLEIAKSGKLNFQKRPADLFMDSMEWGFISGLAVIDFILKCPSIQSLDVEDQAAVFRNCLLPISLLADTMRAVDAKRDFICFPDGTDVVEMNHSAIAPEFDKLVRSRLAVKALDIKLKFEEVLLLSMIVITSPATQGLSLSAQTNLRMDQRSHQSALFNFCRLTNGHCAPTRFAELVELLKVVKMTESDIASHYHIRGANRDPAPIKRLFLPDDHNF